MLKFYLPILILFITSVRANDCLRSALSKMQKDSIISQLESRALEKVNQVLDTAKKISDLKEKSKTLADKGQKKKSQKIDQKIEVIRQGLKARNDSVVRAISALLDTQGIRHTLYSEGGHLSILLDLTQVPKSSHPLRFYARAKRIFGVQKVTISLVDTALKPRNAFFKGNRVEIGLKEFLFLIDNDIGISSRHEFRHAHFVRRKKAGDVSPFHVKFYKSKNGKLLNEKLKYDEYMSGEEIYNWSTDLGTLAKMVRDAKKENLADVLGRVEGKIKGGLIINEALREVTALQISRLKETIRLKKLGRIKLARKNYVGFLDDFGRRVDVLFVGKELGPLSKKARALASLIRKKSLAMTKASWPKKFRETPEGIALVAELEQLKLKITEHMLERLEVLNHISSEQMIDLEKLQNLFDTLGGRPSQIQLEALREQMKKVSNNVKEKFKDSLFLR